MRYAIGGAAGLLMLASACAPAAPPLPATDTGIDSLKAALASSRFTAIITVMESRTDTASTLTASHIRSLATAVAGRHDLEIQRVFSLIPAFVAVVDTARLVTLLQDENVRRVEPDIAVRRQSRIRAATTQARRGLQ